MRLVSKIKQMSNLKKLLLLGGIVVVALALALCVQKPEEITTPTPVQPKELKLSDFPEVFKDNTLIVIGTPDSNPMLKEVMLWLMFWKLMKVLQEKVKVCQRFLQNPWDKDKAMLLVEGWDGFGIESAEWLLQNKQLNKNKVISEWENTMAWIDKKRGIALILNDEYILGEEIEIKIKNFGRVSSQV